MFLSKVIQKISTRMDKHSFALFAEINKKERNYEMSELKFQFVC